MKGKVLSDFNANTNDFEYKKGQIVEIIEIVGFKNSYAIFHNLEQCNTLDWIPKKLIEII